MRLYHLVEGRFHNIVVKTSFPFLVLDFTLGTKSVVPVQVSVDETTINEVPVYFCQECNKEIPTEELFVKCFKCGEMTLVTELFYYKTVGVGFCQRHSEEFKGDEKLSAKPLIYYLGRLTSK